MHIRRLIPLLSAVLLPLLPTSCELIETIQTTPSYFSVTPSRDVVQDVLGAKDVSFEVRCDLPWTVELSDPSWGKIEGKEEKDQHNGGFRFTAPANSDFQARANIVIVKAGDKELRIPVTQQGSSSIIPVERVDITPHSVQSKLALNAPSSWTASVDCPDGWFKLEPLSGDAGTFQLTLTARDANEDKGDRQGSIRFSFGSYDVNLDVVQNQSNVIRLSASSVQVSFLEQELIIDTETNVPYQVEVTEGWVKHLGTKALDQAHESFAIEANPTPDPRTALLRFCTEGTDAVDVRVQLVQLGMDPILNVHAFGAYGVDGNDFVLEDGHFTQLSRLYSPEGRLTLRLLDPAGVQACTVSELDADPQPGSDITLRVQAMAKGFPWLIRTCPSVIIMTDDTTVWAKSTEDPGTYFVLKR